MGTLRLLKEVHPPLSPHIWITFINFFCRWVFLGLLGPAFGHSSRVVRDSMAKNKIIWVQI